VNDEYVFADTADDPEHQRLKAIEDHFDPRTRQHIQETGLTEDWACLEVGPGAGSIMRWLCETVGPDGRVVAVDTDARFIEELYRENFGVDRDDGMDALRSSVGGEDLEDTGMKSAGD